MAIPETRHEARRTASTLIYVLGFIACAIVIALLPPPDSTIGLVILVLGSAAWGLYRLKSPTFIALDATAARISARRNTIAIAFALLGFGLMIAAAFDLRTANAQEFLASGSLKMILGGLALGVAVRASTRLPVLGKPLDLPLARMRRFWWVFAALGILMLALLAEINGMVFHLAVLQAVPSWLQYLLLTSGIGLVGYGFGGAPSLNLRSIKINWSIVLPLGVIIVLALILRLWNGAGAQRYLLDELHYSDGILAVEGRPYLQILTPMSGESPFTWIYPYWQSGAVALLGHNLIGFRFVSVLIGTLTVLAAFGLAREIFDSKTALLAALVLATFPPDVHFSRTAIIQIADPLFGTLMLMFLARALRKNHPIEWALAGISLGMTQYFYEGARLLFPALMVAFVVMLAARGRMRGKERGFLILIVTALIVGVPFYYTLISRGSPLFGRYDDSGLGVSYWQQLMANGVSLNAVSNLLGHLLSGFMIYGAHADLSVYYGGQQALVLDYLLPFFLIGCFYLAWRYPAPAFVIPLWIVATALGNGLLRDTLVSSRYEEVLPALALAIAAGVRYGLEFFLDPLPRPDTVAPTRARLRKAIPVVAVVAIATAQIGYYFGPHLAYFNVQVRSAKDYRDGIDAVMRAVDLPGNTQIYLVGMPVHDQNVPRDWLGFLSRDGEAGRYFPLLSVSPDTISPKYLLNLPRGVNYAFFVEPTDLDALAQIVRYFPNADPPQYSTWDIPADKEYLLLFVPSDTIPLRPALRQG